MLPTIQCPQYRPYISGGLMVRSGTLLHCRTPLHAFETGTVTSLRCRLTVLEPYVHIFRGAVGLDFF